MAQTYEVNQRSINTLIRNIDNNDIVIPQIQRSFVWNGEKTARLLDSLYRGFPVGFISIWKSGNFQDKKGNSVYRGNALIDGQQRLIALSSAILGKEVLDKNFRKLRIQIAFNPITCEFAPLTKKISKDPEWINDVGPIISCKSSSNAVAAAKKYMEDNPEADSSIVNERIYDLHDINDKQVGVIEIIPDTPIETITDIFIRINTSGVSLNQVDFALSRISSYSPTGSEICDAILFFSQCALHPNTVDDLRNNNREFSEGRFFSSVNWIPLTNVSIYKPYMTVNDIFKVIMMKEFQRTSAKELVSSLTPGEDTTLGDPEEVIKRLEKSYFDYTNRHNTQQFLSAISGAGFATSYLTDNNKGPLIFSHAAFLLMRDMGLDMLEVKNLTKRFFVFGILTNRYSTDKECITDLTNIKKVGASKTLNALEKIYLNDSFWESTLITKLETCSIQSGLMKLFWAAQIFFDDRSFLSHSSVRDLIAQRGDIHHIFPKDFLASHGFSYKDIDQAANVVYAETSVNVRIKNKSPKDYMREVRENVGVSASYGNLSSMGIVEQNLKDNCCDAFSLEYIDSKEYYPQFLRTRRGMMAEKIKEYYAALTRQTVS